MKNKFLFFILAFSLMFSFGFLNYSQNIISKNNEYNFQLTDGFKISIDKDKQIEKLEFLNYLLKIENKNINNGEIVDKNTFTILDDFKNGDFNSILNMRTST